jgi:hypothetical protein
MLFVNATLGVWVAYTMAAVYLVVDGYLREVSGHRRGRTLHRVFFQAHTGLHINPSKSYGDDARLKRTGGGNNRATPEGLTIYFSKLKRRGRAVRNNIIIYSFLMLCVAFVVNPPATIVAVMVTCIALITLWIGDKIRRARAANPMEYQDPTQGKAFAQTKAARLVLESEQDAPVPNGIPTRPLSKTESAPRLTTGVQPSVIATLLSQQMGVSPAEIMALLKMSPAQGELILPDTFAALIKQREPIQEIIEAHVEGQVSFSWKTTVTPRQLIWKPVAKKLGLPDKALFRNYLDGLQTLPRGQFGLGLDEDHRMYVSDYNGDTPWHCSSMGSGTGKSSRFLAMGAQICHNDPEADLYCIDTKQVSFEWLKGIPGVHVYDNPQKEMGDIWKVFYTLEGIMRDRYTAVREKRARYSDFNDIWLLVDEGNDLAAFLKSWWKKIREQGEPAQPVIWEEAIAPLLRLGRQCGIRGEFMLQDVTDRALGGASLKMAFSEFTMAGWKEPQFKRILGYAPPPLIEGPGKLLACRGNKQRWVQGFFDEPEWLRDYALANRKGRIAA